MSAGVLCDYSIETLPFTYASTRAYHSLLLYLYHSRRINDNLNVYFHARTELRSLSIPRDGLGKRLSIQLTEDQSYAIVALRFSRVKRFHVFSRKSFVQQTCSHGAISRDTSKVFPTSIPPCLGSSQ
jgi:hypothetical protein